MALPACYWRLLVNDCPPYVVRLHAAPERCTAISTDTNPAQKSFLSIVVRSLRFSASCQVGAEPHVAAILRLEFNSSRR